jgi:hypothetical protein
MPTDPIPEIDINWSEGSQWYMEGTSTALYPADHPHQPGEPIGWFCIEVETFDEVLQQLQELGFIQGKGT